MRHTNMGHLPQEHPFEFYACVSMETTLCNLPSSFPLFPDIRVDVRPALLHVRLCGSINMCQIIFYIIIINYFTIFIDKLHTHTHTQKPVPHTHSQTVLSSKAESKCCQHLIWVWQICQHVSLSCGWLELTLRRDRKPDEKPGYIFTR